MPATLFVVHNSHPCATVEKALALKGVSYRAIELTPPLHVPVMRVRFGRRTVPALRFADGERIQGSRAIVRRLEERFPAPPLYGSGPEERASIEEIERWGDETLQPLVRRLLWAALRRDPAALHALQSGQRLPRLPLPVVRALAPAVTAVELRLNGAGPATVRADLAALPAHLDRLDAWVAEGRLGGERLTAADLQVAPSLRLLWGLEDVRPLMAGRASASLAHAWLEPLPAVPAGALPAAGTAAA